MYELIKALKVDRLLSSPYFTQKVVILRQKNKKHKQTNKQTKPLTHKKLSKRDTNV